MTAALRLLLSRPLDGLRRLLTLDVVLQVIASVLGLGGQMLVNRQDATGFVLWMGANAALIWLQLRLRMYVLVALYVVYMLFCIEGLWMWRGG